MGASPPLHKHRHYFPLASAGLRESLESVDAPRLCRPERWVTTGNHAFGTAGSADFLAGDSVGKFTEAYG
jgi:hypothetical protein